MENQNIFWKVLDEIIDWGCMNWIRIAVVVIVIVVVIFTAMLHS